MVTTNKAESKDKVKAVVLEVSKIVSDMTGVQLGERQSSMVENRLKARMLKLGIPSFADYLKHLKSHTNSEELALLSLLTTHHTYFFREYIHFEFLINHGLFRLINSARNRPDKTIKILSAACSRGQEVYSLAMFFKHHLKALAPDLKFMISGTDVDPECIKYAKNGVYKIEEIKQLPVMYAQGNWIRGKDKVQNFAKVSEELKKYCHFETSNLIHPESYLHNKKFDLIFCRNVFIYFSPEQIQKTTNQLLTALDPMGYLILGTSETLTGLKVDVDLIGSSIYQGKVAKESEINIPKFNIELAAKAKTIDVLCIDDSPTIHSLLAKILTEKNGFCIKRKAMNGKEALDILKNEKFDVITLDLHMPEVDGLNFLKMFNNKNTPVVVLSSINRDDTSTAQQAIKLGAKDYVEKPSLETISQAADQICSKLRSVILESSSASPATKTVQTKKKKVLVVDDSAVIRKLLKDIISKDPDLEVIAEAEKPSQVEKIIQQQQPDVMTLDIHMPEMDGVSLLKQLFPKYKIPTVIISSTSKDDGPFVLQALEIGAVDYIQKPEMDKLQDVAQQIRERIKIAAMAKIRGKAKAKKVSKVSSKDHLVVLGASTGGTEALRVVLESLPNEIPPFLIVQHIPKMFSAAFAKRLNELLPFEVREAKDGDLVKANQVLIAPGGKQMGVKVISNQIRIVINDDPAMNRHRPSVDYLFKSIHDAAIPNVVAGILTGMGSDGAKMLKVLRLAGARTIAQDQETSVVYGMPREAKELGAAEFILPIESIGEKIAQLCTKSHDETKEAS